MCVHVLIIWHHHSQWSFFQFDTDQYNEDERAGRNGGTYTLIDICIKKNQKEMKTTDLMERKQKLIGFYFLPLTRRCPTLFH